MNRNSLFTLAAFAGTTLFAPLVHADEVIITTLSPVITDVIPATKSQKIVLSPTKPDGVKSTPAFIGKPQYGTLKLGDAKDNQVLIALDVPEGTGRIRLYVDTNGNGDLSDETAISLTLPPPPVKNKVRGNGAKEKADKEKDTEKKAPAFVGSVALTIHYNIAGRGADVPSALQFSYSEGQLSYNRGYSRLGKITNGKKSYPVALIDQNVDARFDVFDHEEDESAKVTILIDRNLDGKFDFEKEAYDAAKLIRIYGGQYRVRAIDPKGTRLTLRKAGGKKFQGTGSAKDLKVGAPIIEFDADTLDGSVSFVDDYRGKIVLLDFWASWDPDAQAELPNTVKVYEAYHSRGFEILGVSLDQVNQRASVQKFMQELGITWDVIYDGKFVNAGIAKLYGIESLPSAFLVDGDTGLILAKGDELRGAGLQEAVQKALFNRTR